MDRRTAYSNLRRMIGNPAVNETSPRDLDDYIASAADWLATVLKNQYRTETALLGLVLDQQELPLPDDLGWVLFAEWNATRLTPSSHFQWDRNGTTYRTASSGNPSEFAVYERKLILMPPPSATAITTDGDVTIRYIATAAALSAAGIGGIGDFDMRLMLWDAAYEYLGLYPSDENQARAVFCKSQRDELLPAALERSRKPIEDQAPQWWPKVTRMGAAR